MLMVNGFNTTNFNTESSSFKTFQMCSELARCTWLCHVCRLKFGKYHATIFMQSSKQYLYTIVKQMNKLNWSPCNKTLSSGMDRCFMPCYALNKSTSWYVGKWMR